MAVLQETRAIEAGMGRMIKAMKSKTLLLIPIVMFLFSLCGSVFGMAEETIPFIPIFVSLMIAAGYDSITGVAIVFCGASAGFAGAFINPFTVVLVLLAIFSALTNVAMVDPGDESWATVIIITIMVLISGILRFVQETRSGNVAAKLSEMIHTTVCVTREGEKKEIPLEEIVVGDIVSLSAGDMLPADVRILRAKDLFLSQSSLTGESEPVEKSGAVCQTVGSLTECGNLAFMGSTVVSGSATAVVLAVGHDTMLGAMAKALNVKPPKTTFEKATGFRRGCSPFRLPSV